MIDKAAVLAVLSRHITPEKISGVVIKGANIGFALNSQDEALRVICEKAVFALPGVEKVTAVLTGEEANSIKVSNKNTEILDRRQLVPGARKVIMIASGKGGVGKSTVAVNLAVAAALRGKRVGLMDADIYGPSVPMMLGLQKPGTGNRKPEMINGKMIPFKKHGLVCNSIGFLLAENDAAIWRGPMAAKALHQLMIGTQWDVNGELDCLFIDMPPGTGDIQLTLAQNYRIDGAILVSTPQALAISDVRRAAKMFERTKIPLLGLVQNMSYLEDANGGGQYIFGKDGARKFAEDHNISFLGDIPLIQTLRENSDNGTPAPIPQFTNIVKILLPT